MKTKLKILMEDYLAQPRPRSSTSRFLDEINLGNDFELPILVNKSSWVIERNPERLVRAFEFQSVSHRNHFISELLAYEEEFGHHGRLCIESNSVIVEVYTLDLERVTELDQEYASQCDAIFTDVELMEE